MNTKRKLNSAIAMTIVLQIYPNGEFTHGVDSSHRRDKCRPRENPPAHELVPVGDTLSLRSDNTTAEIHKDCIHAMPGDTFRNHAEECTYTYLCADMGKHIYAIEYDYGFVTVDTLHTSLARLINKGAVAPIGLSDSRTLKKMPEKRRTPSSMTKRMARLVRNAGHILQEDFGKDNLSFLTLTIPNLSTSDLHKLAVNWGAMVHKFLVWLRYRVEKYNFPLSYVHCTEIQQKRLENRHEFAPHLHLLFRGRYGKKFAWAITPLMARKAWTRCLRAVLGHSNFDNRALENLRQVRSNAAGYISKYMSKGCCSLPSVFDGFDWSSFSTDWGAMDRTTRKRISDAQIVLRGDGAFGRVAWILLRGMEYLVQQRIVAFYKAGFIRLSKGDESEGARGLHVGVGRFACPIDDDSIHTIVQIIMNNCEKDLTDFWSTSYAAKPYG